MTISWVNSEGKEGIAENDYEFAMQHQMVDAQVISDVVPRRQEDLGVSGASEYKSPLRQLNEALDITNVIKPPGPMTGSVSQDMLGSIPMSMSGLRPGGVRLTPVTSPKGMDWNRLQINGQYARHQVPMTGVGHVHPAVEQFGPIIATQLGSQYLYDYPEQAQKIMNNIITAAGAADLELTPQSRIDQSFSDIPKKKYDDQNNPAVWGLGEINQNIESDMQDPGPKQRQENIQQELDSGQNRQSVERQASLKQQLGDPSQIPASTYQQFADYVHDLRVKFTGEPDKWSGKEIVGDFLDKAMSVMGAGMRIPKVPMRTGVPERVVSPAIKSSKGVFEGENHGVAYDKADFPQNYVDGYVTNKGRFVTREEAAGIAKGQEQVLMEARQTEELHSGELKPGYERSPVVKSAAQEAFDAKVASGKKIGAADYPHVQEEFLKAINEGVTGANELATRLRLSDAQVRAVAKATDVNLNDFRTSWNEKNTQQLKDMISEGKTYAEVAKELGVSRGAVGGKVDRLGLEIQNDQSTGAGKRNVPKIYTDELRDKIRVMYAKGKTSAEIAEEMGLNAATLRFQTAKHKLRK